MDESKAITEAQGSLAALQTWLVEHAASFVVTVVVAIVLWVLGRWLINFLVKLVQRSLARQKFDPTVLRYVGSFITVTLNIILVIAILGYCGIETTSFAALLAAVGLAIGMAWSGLLANLAAGGFIIVLRPFKVGDVVEVGGVKGTVVEIGLFVTSINTPENVLALVGNNKVFAENIFNYTTHLFRRLEWSVALPREGAWEGFDKLVATRLGQLPHILPEPGPVTDLRIDEQGGAQLEVKAYCEDDERDAMHEVVQSLLDALVKEAGRGKPAPTAG
ncbi:mechanosensitive ion channel family protein [Pseudomonas putida]|uniref:Small-conductance mechanosensitive channel n=1 Tax=Pseudomonas putida TaxID=303 RepID=A0A4D6X838_PSEPU|nr:mechanosensitive ion channel family protein [Pseudomonas putida]QCI12124.1 mechanosensitive ion channel family protein [Pseudomonas putida]